MPEEVIGDYAHDEPPRRFTAAFSFETDDGYRLRIESVGSTGPN